MTAPPGPELVADGLSYPTSLAFDDEGSPWVAEAGPPFGVAGPGGRVWRLAPNGERQLVVENLSPPVNGLCHHEGSFFVSVGGHPSRIIRVWVDGRTEVVLERLTGPGDYQTNMTVVGRAAWLYFSQGAMGAFTGGAIATVEGVIHRDGRRKANRAGRAILVPCKGSQPVNAPVS